MELANRESEQKVLAVLLVDATSLAKVVQQVQIDDFYVPEHRQIYAAMQRLYKSGLEFDLLAISQEVPEHRSYLNQLALSFDTTAGLEYHLNTLRTLAFRRRVDAFAARLRDAVTDSDPETLAMMLDDVPCPTHRRQLKTITAPELMAKIIEPPRWAIEDLLPEGLTILAGLPKSYKSWLALQIAVGVSTGGNVLGQHWAERGSALYLALEDDDGRLQRRLRTLQQDDEAYCPALVLCPDDTTMSDGGIQLIEDWLRAHPDCRLVIIDTLARFMPVSDKGVNAYQADYATISRLQRMALQKRIALLVVHHLRKMKADDVFAEISGSAGITGPADAMWVLKREREHCVGELFVTGRDIEEKKLSLEFDKEAWRWTLQPDPHLAAKRKYCLRLHAEFGDTTFTAQAAATALGVSVRQGRRVVSSLADAGYVLREKHGKEFHFRLTQKITDIVLGGASA